MTKHRDPEARKAAGRRYYYKNREAVLAKLKDEYHNNPELRAKRDQVAANWKAANPEHCLWHSCKANTRKRGNKHEFTITLEQVKELCAPMICSMTGIALTWGGGPWGPSLDRIDNSKGYTSENIRLVCWAYNSMRGEWDDKTLLTVAQALASRH